MENYELSEETILRAEYGDKLTETSLNRIMNHGKDGFVIISTNRSAVCPWKDEEEKVPDYEGDNSLFEEYIIYCVEHNIPMFELNDNKTFKEDDFRDYVEFCKTKNLIPYSESEEEFLSYRNKKCDEEFKKYLRSSDNPYTFTPVFGGYHGMDSVTDSYEPSYIVYNSVNKYKKKEGSWEDLKNKALEWCGKYKQDSVYIQEPNEAPIYMDKNGNKVNTSETKDFKFNRNDEMFYTTTKRDKTNPQRFTANIMWENMRCPSRPSSYNEKIRYAQRGEYWDVF